MQVSVEAVDAAFASLLRAGPPSLSRTPSLRVDSPSHSVDSPTDTNTSTHTHTFSPVKLEEPTAAQVRVRVHSEPPVVNRADKEEPLARDGSFQN